jgi:hypothetical protein
MKKAYVLRFLHRGLIFGGFGPIIAGIVYISLSLSIDGFLLTGTQVFWAALSTYLLAFLQAGASVFNQVEHWPLAKCMFFHFFTIYVAYLSCYLINSWIPRVWWMLLVFTAIFVAVYLIVWLAVVLSLKIASKRFNQRLK